MCVHCSLSFEKVLTNWEVGRDLANAARQKVSDKARFVGYESLQPGSTIIALSVFDGCSVPMNPGAVYTFLPAEL